MPNIKTSRESKLMWNYQPTEEDMKAVSYCMGKGIHISMLPIPNDRMNYYIEVITFNGGKVERKKDPNIHPIEKVSEQIYKYYKHYYTKRNEK